ncbi:MAG: hypothetical protein SHS37scaffold220_42 [Phage 67_12]|nr:MAG: hypothetical protein SHS37scaffold220_42 [Phage 67_12]
MADEPKNETPGLPDVHPGNVAPMLCKKLCVPGVIVITSNEDGSMMMIAHGVTHARAAEMLSRGTQINLNQHDDHVRAGEAGPEAAANQALVDGVEHSLGTLQ